VKTAHSLGRNKTAPTISKVAEIKNLMEFDISQNENKIVTHYSVNFCVICSIGVILLFWSSIGA
jgi:hypothetical protein